MSIVKVTLPGGEIPVNGKQVSFIAPCDCTQTEALQIEGVNYTIVDALCNCVTGKGGRWDVGAVVSVILDVDKKLAYIQNANLAAEQVALAEATAAALGLPNGASVDDALGVLSRFKNGLGNECVWSKTGTVWEEVRNYVTFCCIFYNGSGTSAATQTVTYCDEISIDANGGISAVNGQTVSGNYTYFQKLGDIFKGKYVYLDSNRAAAGNEKYPNWFYIPSGAGFADNGIYGVYQIAYSDVYVLSTTQTTKFLGYVNSSDPNAYPQDGEVDGVYYKYVKQLGEAGVKIETGSYVGSDTYGESGANSLTFSFTPKMVFLVMREQANNPNNISQMFGTNNSPQNIHVLPMYLLTTTYKGGFGFTDGTNTYNYAKKSEDGKTLYWHNSYGNPGYQANSSAYRYYYLAIG